MTKLSRDARSLRACGQIRLEFKPGVDRSGRPAAYVRDPRRVDVFDPALKQYPGALVNGPPNDADVAQRLAETRSSLLQDSLEALARSDVRDALVLRGSLTLERWFGERARRAKDIDLVVRDASCLPDGADATRLLSQIAGAVTGALAAAGVHLPDAPIPVDRIWTYERAEGRRLSIPWTFAEGSGLHETIQIDVVFREPLQDQPHLEPVCAVGDAPYRASPPCLWFASRAESLAWKILWLDTDMHPQGKDVYDAVLLAEDTPLSLRLLERVYAEKREKWRHGKNTAFLGEHKGWIDWNGFSQEYPSLGRHGGKESVQRLGEVLRFTE
jgi:hypothetical protein